MHFHIITIFPEIFDSYFSQSIIKKAVEAKKIKISVYDLRKWAKDKHKTVDDRPFGGGAGMLMKPEPIISAIKAISRNKKGARVILFEASGKSWEQKKANSCLGYRHIIMVCGRYEGIDDRVKYLADEKISIGKFVLTGGEIPAMTVVDSITRLIPGVLGNVQSAQTESFQNDLNEGEYPQFTRPRALLVKGKMRKVPEVLLSGNHKEIEKWRNKHLKNSNK